MAGPNVNVVDVGQTITWPTGFPVNATRQHVVKPRCDLNDGRWGCVTHQTMFANNLAASIHEEDPHRHVVVWLCDEHGPEVP